MKIEQIFCDICGKEGATTRGKDQKILTMSSSFAKDHKHYLIDDNSVPMITLSFGKKNINQAGSIEEIDLCSRCSDILEVVVRNATAELILERKKKKRIKEKSTHK